MLSLGCFGSIVALLAFTLSDRALWTKNPFPPSVRRSWHKALWSPPRFLSDASQPCPQTHRPALSPIRRLPSPIRRLPSTGNRKPYSMAARPSTIQHSWPDPPPHPYSFVLTASRVLDSGPVTHQDLGEDGSGIRKDSPLPCLRPRRASCAPQKNFGSRPCPFAFYTQVQWLTPGRVSRPVRVHGQGGVPPRRAFSCGGTGAFQSSYQPSRLTKPTGSAARPPILS